MKKRIADWARSASSAFIIVLICLTAFAPAARAAFPDFRFTAESIVYERVQLRQVDVELDAGNRFAVSIGLAELGEIKKTFDNLSVNGVLQTFENGKDRLLVRSSLQSGKIEADLELLVVARDL